MAEYTKGPWYVVDWGRAGVDVMADAGDEKRLRIAEIHAIDKVAHAHLIAAAPELLEACELALRDLEGIPGVLPSEARRLLRRVIAKAKGDEDDREDC